jgi:hypothetical protein
MKTQTLDYSIFTVYLKTYLTRLLFGISTDHVSIKRERERISIVIQIQFNKKKSKERTIKTAQTQQLCVHECELI